MPVSLSPVIPPDNPGTPTTRLEKWSIIVAPEAYPVTAAEFRQHAYIDNAADSVLMQYVAAATDYAEDAMELALMPRTILANYFDGEPLVLPRGPLLSIVSIVDRDENDVATGYKLSHVGHQSTVTLARSATYPVSITYTAGYADAATVPAAIRLAIMQHAATLWENRESVSDRTKTVVPHGMEDFYRRKSRGRGIG